MRWEAEKEVEEGEMEEVERRGEKYERSDDLLDALLHYASSLHCYARILHCAGQLSDVLFCFWWAPRQAPKKRKDYFESRCTGDFHLHHMVAYWLTSPPNHFG